MCWCFSEATPRCLWTHRPHVCIWKCDWNEKHMTGVSLRMCERKRCWFLTPYLHWREEAPYWKRHCSSASYTCPGATVGYRKSRFRGSLSRHVPRPELSKKQTYNRIVSYTKKPFYTRLMAESEGAKIGWLKHPSSLLFALFHTFNLTTTRLL